MNNIEVHLVAIPARLWASWPTDRALALLAQDALGIERRIDKGVNVRKERARYTLLCNQIESLALRLVRSRKVTRCVVWTASAVGEKKAATYLQLIEALREHDIGHLLEIASAIVASRKPSLLQQLAQLLQHVWRAFRHAEPPAQRREDELRYARKQPLGKSFYPPGRAVTQQREIFDGITEASIAALFPNCSTLTAQAFEHVAQEKARFYRHADRDGAAIVEVISLSAISPLVTTTVPSRGGRSGVEPRETPE